jgi:hypothetical protein
MFTPEIVVEIWKSSWVTSRAQAAILDTLGCDVEGIPEHRHAADVGWRWAEE